MIEQSPPTWRHVFALATLVFLIAAAGSAAASALWLKDVSSPQVAFLGSGNRLSLFLADGPARMVIASGDDPVGYENALARFLPLFARRTDVLFVAGEDRTLLVPLAAVDNGHVGAAYALWDIPVSPETKALGPLQTVASPFRVRLGPNLAVTVETAPRVGGDATEGIPAWRATVECGGSRVVVLSDGAAAALFPPSEPASVLAVAGDEPLTGWRLSPAVALVITSDAIEGPELRSAFQELSRPPSPSFRVGAGETVRLRFVEGGIEILSPSDQEDPVVSVDVRASPRAGN